MRPSSPCTHAARGREALASWNRELERDLRDATRAQPRPWAFFFNALLRASVRAVPGEGVVALSRSPELISRGGPVKR